MTEHVLNVLFLCTGNSARSILAESILNHVGKGRFRAYSAGSHPNCTVNPFVLDLLKQQGLPTEGLRSKRWDEFVAPDAPKLDFVFTVCDNAAGEVCPVWPGQPMTAHWGLPDPVKATGTEAEKALAFGEVYEVLEDRLSTFVALPIATLDRLSLQHRLDALGQPEKVEA